MEIEIGIDSFWELSPLGLGWVADLLLRIESAINNTLTVIEYIQST